MRHKILLIDDDPNFVKVTKSLLEANNFIVITADNGQDGFQIVKKESPSIVILDVSMTYETEGIETAKAISSDAAVRQTPIIMVTNAKKESLPKFDFTDGKLSIKMIFEKPIDPETLLKAIRNCLESENKELFEKKISVENLIKKWEGVEGNLIMILHEIQNHYGYVPRDVAFTLRRCMNIPLARIYEVISFYNYFKLEPPGKHIISVCLGTACYLKGAPKLLDEIKQILDIEEGQTTQDGMFQLQSVRCLGCCGLAPVMMIDGKIYGNLKPKELMDIISEYSKKELVEK